MVWIGGGQSLLDGFDYRYGVLRIEPEMHVILACHMVMACMFLMLGVFFVLAVICVLGMLFVLSMFLSVVAIASQTASFFNTGNLRQRNCIRRMAERGERRTKKGLKPRSNPKHQLGTLQSFGIRWLQAIDMRRAETFNNEMGFANPFHHCRDQGMNGFDGGDNLRT